MFNQGLLSQRQEQKEVEMSETTNRVKVYRLFDGNWHDQGTGSVSFHKAEKTTDDGDSNPTLIIAVLDESSNHEIIKTTATSIREFERQGDRIIMWKDPGGDCALSFQDIQSCSYLWHVIILFQNEEQRELSKGIGQIDTTSNEDIIEDNIHLGQMQGSLLQDFNRRIMDAFSDPVDAGSASRVIKYLDSIESSDEHLALAKHLMEHDIEYISKLLAFGVSVFEGQETAQSKSPESLKTAELILQAVKTLIKFGDFPIVTRLMDNSATGIIENIGRLSALIGDISVKVAYEAGLRMFLRSENTGLLGPLAT